MSTPTPAAPQIATATRKKYVPAVGPRLKRLLAVVFGLFALLGINSVYLSSITLMESFTGRVFQDWFYQYMFLTHLLLGVLIVLPVIVFGIIHIINSNNRPNKRAIRVGYALFATAIILLLSGIVITRVEGLPIMVRDGTPRNVAYWAHVISPLVAMWLFVLHRLAGRKIKWKVGMSWAGVAGCFAAVMAVLHYQDPRRWNETGPESGVKYFFPSLARTATGNFVPAKVLMADSYCRECHPDIHEGWSNSVHRFSSFNNPAYLFSVLNTRKAMHERDGNVTGSRFCAGCHDPVPFFSGAFDDKKFDDPNYDLASDSMAQAGITCTTCHAITHVNSPRGNSDFTIEEPQHYPFAFSDSPMLRWVNRQLIKAKPAFHKKTFLKPLHKTAEFCGSCHKVHLPEELNDYKWLRGQNHYDPFLLSGVSGHGITSFYYPPKAQENCNGCHMPTRESQDFGARVLDDTNQRKIHGHQFPSANTAIPHLLNMPESVNAEHRKFNEGVMRVDIFGVKEGGTIDSPLTAPIRPTVPTVKPGGSYLIETVIRTVKMGHLFTQGTADSNEVWMDVTVRSGDRVIGRSGGMKEDDGEVDPWSHFVNAYVIDRHGNRIDRRNAEDIFVPLYNHQIPPGAGQVVHYALKVPSDAREPITVDIALRYRKFDTLYMKYFQGEKFVTNDLPIMTLATDSVTFAIDGTDTVVTNPEFKADLWQRWNDYGIGLLSEGDSGANKGELRSAEQAFAEVEKLGRPDGPLNRARVYIKEGRLDEAVTALRLAADAKAPPWSVAWFTGMVNKQNGFLDEAIENFRAVLAMKDSAECRERGFDFTRDYRVLAELGQTLVERSKMERGESRRGERDALLNEAKALFNDALALDPENTTAHFNLALIFGQLGDPAEADKHNALFEKYRVDDNARDLAIARARQNSAAANFAAEAIVIYDLQRAGAYELPPQNSDLASNE